MRDAGFAGVRTWHFNIAGAAAWWLNGTLLRRERPPARQIAAFDALVPVLRRLDGLARFGIGLSLFALGHKAPPA